MFDFSFVVEAVVCAWKMCVWNMPEGQSTKLLILTLVATALKSNHATSRP
jgi:FKBP-type peptidyl-prolyl cis-trans isomerase